MGQDLERIEAAVYSWNEPRADFADCLIEAHNRRLECRATATCDGRALKLAGFLPVLRGGTTMTRRTAIVIGSGIGGIACAIRLQSLGFDTTILEKLDEVGGRAYVRRAQGFTFDMGPTVLTVPHFIEELFALERTAPMLDEPDFPAEVLAGSGSQTVSAAARTPAAMSRSCPYPRSTGSTSPTAPISTMTPTR